MPKIGVKTPKLGQITLFLGKFNTFCTKIKTIKGYLCKKKIQLQEICLYAREISFIVV